MAKEKPFSEFSMKNWRNLGIYLVLLGLIIMFIGKEWLTGLGFLAVGVIFTAIFHGPKLLKILKKENW